SAAMRPPASGSRWRAAGWRRDRAPCGWRAAPAPAAPPAAGRPTSARPPSRTGWRGRTGRARGWPAAGADRWRRWPRRPPGRSRTRARCRSPSPPSAARAAPGESPLARCRHRAAPRSCTWPWRALGADLLDVAPQRGVHEPVHRVDVGAGARLDHVGRGALAEDDRAVEVHLHRDLAQRVLARGDRPQLVVLQPALHPGDGVDGVQHRVHRAVAHPRVLEDLLFLLEPHGGGRDDPGPADRMQVVEGVGLGDLGDVVLDDRDQVVVEDLLLPVREVLEALEGLAEAALVELEAQILEPRGQRVPAGVLAHHELVGARPMSWGRMIS